MADTKSRMKAAIYLRISKDTEKTGDAIERQREDCQFICSHYDYEVYDTYIDQNVSAFSGVERPQFERMLRDYRAGKFQVIVAWKLDRLARRSSTIEDMAEELHADGLYINTSDVGEQDLSRSDSMLIIRQLVSFAQFESARKSERQLRANEQRLKRGQRKRGYCTFGYDLEGNIIEENANVVRAIYAAVVAGHTLSSIARALSGKEHIEGLSKTPRLAVSKAIVTNQHRAKRGLPPKKIPEDGSWVRNGIMHLLRNPYYAGYIGHMPSTEWAKHESTRRRLKEFIVLDDNGKPMKATDHKAIVDESTWWAVQDILDTNADTAVNKTNQRKYLGTGVFLCGTCKKPMWCSSGSYRCSNPDCTRHVSRRASRIDKLVTDVVIAKLSETEFREAYSHAIAPDVTAIDRQIDEAKTELMTLLRGFRKGIIKDDELVVLRREPDARIAQLERERTEALSGSIIGGLISSDDIQAAFEALPVKRKGMVIDELMTVTLLPHQTGNHSFDGSDVIIDWK